MLIARLQVTYMPNSYLSTALSSCLTIEPLHNTLRTKDYERMLAAEVHIGTKNLNFGMRDYIFKRRDDSTCGVHSLLAFILHGFFK